MLSIRKKFDSGDVTEHLSRKLSKTRAKRVRQKRGEGGRKRGERERERERE